MATWLALDLSLSSTGFVLWEGGDAEPVMGHWQLSDLKWRSRGYVRLHKELLALHRATPIDEICFEEPLTQASLSGQTNVATLQALAGLAAHAESFAAAVGASIRPVNIASWRRHFLGRIARGTKSVDLKAMTGTRCRELGFKPACNDESDAFGILDYQLSVCGIIPPWRQNILQRELLPATDERAAHASRG